MTNEKNPKKPQNFNCKICDFECYNKKDYSIHLFTAKHKILTNTNEKTPKNPKAFMCSCGKVYKHASSLSGHKRKCVFKESNIKETEKETDKEDIDYKEVILTLVKQNNELQQTIVGQQNTIKEMIPKIGNTINNTTNTTNNNNQFNLQMFLNEDCKNALNIKDFVNSLQLTINDLTNTGKLGYVD